LEVYFTEYTDFKVLLKEMRIKKLVLLLILLIGRIEMQADSLSGMIAYIGADFNVYTAVPGENNSHPLTRDASASRRYQYPVWSNDGRLAYFCCDPSVMRRPVAEVYISEPEDYSGELVYMAEREVFTYAYWSPKNCKTGDDCRDLAVLLGGNRDGFKVELIRNTAAASSKQFTDTGAPFYFSWSPDGTEMLWHRNNTSVDIYNVESQTITPIPELIPGLFPAPMWSPVNDRLLVGVFNETDRTTELMTYDRDTQVTLQTGIRGQVAFNWSPDGQRIAYRTLDRNGYGGLVVINAANGEVIARSDTENVLAFFWSPDSQKLVYAVFERRTEVFDANNTLIAQDEDELQIAWIVFNPKTGESRRLLGFIPTREMIYLLTYFDQFAQSHRIWNPDSAHIVFSEILEGSPSVTILDTEDTNAVPFPLAEGIFGIWSYQ
jgi:TolB protein